MEETSDRKDNKGDLYFCVMAKHMIILTIACIIAIIASRHIITINYIPSSSMEPTLNVGDVIIGNGLKKDIERYDIIVFYPPKGVDSSRIKTRYIKRVIGLPGETVEIRDNHIYINGVEMDDSFCQNMHSKDGIYMVPENSYFVMGDNRDHSYDTRFWKEKYVEKDAIVSVVKWLIYPYNKRKSL